LVLLLPACGSKTEPGAPAPGAPGGGGAAVDMKTPYLTEKKIEGMIALTKDNPNFWASRAGKPPSAATAEMHALAKKYGFSNFQDLAETAARVTMGMAAVGMAKLNASEFEESRQAMKDSPGLPADMKGLMQKHVEDTMAATGDLNEKDRKLVEKYYDRLDALSD